MVQYCHSSLLVVIIIKNAGIAISQRAILGFVALQGRHVAPIIVKVPHTSCIAASCCLCSKKLSYTTEIARVVPVKHILLKLESLAYIVVAVGSKICRFV